MSASPTRSSSDVALEVDGEAVRPHRLLGRARLEPGHVDAAGGELLEQLEQAAGVVVALEEHDGRLVGAGALTKRVTAAPHVADVVGEDPEAVEACRGGGAHGGVVGLGAGLEPLGGRGRRLPRTYVARGEVARHPAADLGPGMRVGADGPDVVQAETSPPGAPVMTDTSSPVTTSGSPLARASSVAETPPSTEFSMGTIAPSLAPARRAARAASTDPKASRRAPPRREPRRRGPST